MKKATIGRYEKYSDGSWRLCEVFSADSPYWKIDNGKIFYVLWDVIRGSYVERSLSDVCMSAREADLKKCGCYYSIHNYVK